MKKELKDILEQSMLFGMGVFDASKETVESFVDDMLDRGRIQKDEADTLREEYRAKKEAEKVEMKNAFKERIAEIVLNKIEEDEEYRNKIKELLEK